MENVIVESIEIPEFTVEDCDVIFLNGGIKKTFTSRASINSMIYKWKFGDETDPSNYTTTKDRSIIHEYKKPGTYTVRHQACLLDGPCCYNNNIPWCVKSITIGTPVVPAGITPLLGLGLLFGLLIQKKKCEDYKNIKDCEKDKNCQIIDKVCVQRCKKGLRIEKIENKYKCRPINK